MIVKQHTEHHLEFLNLKEAAEANLSLHMSKCHIVGNLMQRLILNIASHLHTIGKLCAKYEQTTLKL